MTMHPREPLTADERALAARLPRLHGPDQPDALLDARILAAARMGTATPAPMLRPRLRWIAPMAVAASLSLAVGLAWRLRPPEAVSADAPPAEAAMTEGQDPRMVATPVNPPLASDPAIPPPASPRGSARPPRQPPAVDEPLVIQRAAAPPPPAPPPSGSLAGVERAAVTDMGAAPTVAPESSQDLAKARASGDARTPASAATAPRAQANEAAMAADTAAGDPQPTLADDPGEEVPPATADSPEVREAWLRRIGELMQQGRREDASASLAEFRRRYPDAPLPPDLRALEP